MQDPTRLKLVEEWLEADAPFGIVYLRPRERGEGQSAPSRVGTTARIIDARRQIDGGLQLSVVGIRRFTIEELCRRGERLYARVAYETEEAAPSDALELARGLFLVYREALRSWKGAKEAPPLDLPASDARLPYAIAERLSVSQAERQRLLEGDGEERLALALHFLRRELDILRLMEEDTGSVP